MMSRERLIRAMRKKTIDRVPINIRGILNKNMDGSYKDLQAFVMEHADIVVGWGGCDVLFDKQAKEGKIRKWSEPGMENEDMVINRMVVQTPKGTLEGEILFSKSQGLTMEGKHLICCEEDVEKFLSLPYEGNDIPFEKYFEVDRYIGERGIVRISLGDAMLFVHDLVGSETLAYWSVEKRDLIYALLDEMNRRICNYYLAPILSKIEQPMFELLGPELVLPPLMAPGEFDRFIVQYDKKPVSMVHEKKGLVSVHCHGSISRVLEKFIDMGADCLHPIEAPPMGDVELKDAKKRIGEHICIEGNIQIGDVMTKTKEEMRQICRKALEDAKGSGGFILGITASPFMKTADEQTLENYRTIVETGLEYGAYV